VNRLHVTFVGDLKYGRTVHSLVRLLGLYEGIIFNYVSPRELKLPPVIFKEMERKGFKQKELTSLSDLEEVITHIDV